MEKKFIMAFLVVSTMIVSISATQVISVDAQDDDSKNMYPLVMKHYSEAGIQDNVLKEMQCYGWGGC